MKKKKILSTLRITLLAIAYSFISFQAYADTDPVVLSLQKDLTHAIETKNATAIHELTSQIRLLTGNCNETLPEAIIKGDLPLIQCVFKKEANVNEPGQHDITSLALAANQAEGESEGADKKGAKANEPDQYDITPLALAVSQAEARPEIVEYLLNQGADPHYMGRYKDDPKVNPLYLAWRAKGEDKNKVLDIIIHNMVDKVIGSEGKPYKGCSNSAIREYTISYLKDSCASEKEGVFLTALTWLENGADIHNVPCPNHLGPWKNAEHAILHTCDPKAASWKLGAGNALHAAVEFADEPMVKYLLCQGIDPNLTNEIGETPLHIAAYKGYTKIAKTLLEKEGIQIDKQGKHNETALMIAASFGHEEMVDLLLYNKASVNAYTTDYHFTALHKAAQKLRLKIIKKLIEAGANIMTQTKAIGKEKPEYPLDLATDTPLEKLKELYSSEVDIEALRKAVQKLLADKMIHFLDPAAPNSEEIKNDSDQKTIASPTLENNELGAIYSNNTPTEHNTTTIEAIVVTVDVITSDTSAPSSSDKNSDEDELE